MGSRPHRAPRPLVYVDYFKDDLYRQYFIADIKYMDQSKNSRIEDFARLIMELYFSRLTN
jgi:hypothetical protein